MITFKRQRFVKLHTYLQVCKVLITLPAINRPAQNVQLSWASRVQWRPCRRHSCWNSGLLLWKIRAGNTCGPTFHNHFVLCGNFCDCRCNGAMTTLLFRQRNTEGSVSPTRPSATPTSCTWIGHANADRARFFQVHALVEHISPRSTTLSSQDRARAKDLENAIYPPNLFLFRKKE